MEVTWNGVHRHHSTCPTQRYTFYCLVCLFLFYFIQILLPLTFSKYKSATAACRCWGSWMRELYDFGVQDDCAGDGGGLVEYEYTVCTRVDARACAYAAPAGPAPLFILFYFILFLLSCPVRCPCR
uniref:Uncharacterized protein n=1 Tax=Trypanosoma vivax (strain Y486) TaxID=1055687 RepID=G0U7R4_TRYVY|nr:hypothetical protein TVY486_1009670 [Trypanosoma vivax Y486]